VQFQHISPKVFIHYKEKTGNFTGYETIFIQRQGQHHGTETSWHHSPHKMHEESITSPRDTRARKDEVLTSSQKMLDNPHGRRVFCQIADRCSVDVPGSGNQGRVSG